jgi:stage II sporulation SpoAA-like protein
MFEIMQGFPDDVLAVGGKGRISAEDYRDTLIPEALRRIKHHGSLRLLCYLGPEFEGATPGAIWADTKLALTHWGDFGRIAVVTDVKWLVNAVDLFAPLFHYPVRVFPKDRLEERQALD